jgi:acylphosphatase
LRNSDGVSGFLTRVTGSVQGVGFRAWTRHEASKLGLNGYVRNLPDRSVEVVATGDAAALDALLTLLKSGPPGASVQSHDTTWLDECSRDAPNPSVTDGFQIRFQDGRPPVIS